MNKHFSSKLILLIQLTIGVSLISCEPDKKTTGAYENGAFIVNEGSFGNSNGSVSYYSNSTDSVYNNIFQTTNNRGLGDVVQSLRVYNGNAYIVVNNSNKIEIADRYSFEEKGVISELPSPRYMAFHGNKAYVSCWGDNSVKVIDLNTQSVTSSIASSVGPEKMIVHNNKLYVANTGGWSSDSILNIVDLSTETVIKSLVVKHTPTDLVINSKGDIWVLCAGKIIYGPEDPWPIIEETPSMLYKIDTETNEVVLEVKLFDDQHPTQIEIDRNDILYYGGGYGFYGIYSWDEPAGATTTTQIVTEYAYGFNIDPSSNVIFATLAPSFTDAGVLKRYDLSGLLLGSYVCGIGPNAASFKSANKKE